MRYTIRNRVVIHPFTQSGYNHLFGILMKIAYTIIPGEMTFAINRHHLAGVGCISDDEAKYAVAFAFRHLKVVVEPGGAAALAAVLSGKVKPKDGKPMIVVMTGGNIDPAVMMTCLDTPLD